MLVLKNHVINKISSVFILLLLGFTSVLPKTAYASAVKTVADHALGDVTGTFLSWPALIIVGGAIAGGSIYSFDERIQSNFSGGPKLGGFNSAAKYIGAPYVLGPSSLLIFGSGVLFKSERVAFLGENLTEAFLMNLAVTGILKVSFGRQRPNGGNLSFPSWHASGMFATATVLEVLEGPLWGIPAYLLAGMVSYSRLDSNSHFLSDVVFGAALGTAIGLGTSWYHKKKNKRFFILPMTGDSKGLSLVYPF